MLLLYSGQPQWDTVDVDVTVPSVENPELINVLHFSRTWNRPESSHECFAHCQIFLLCPNFHLPGPSLFFFSFSPNPLPALVSFGFGVIMSQKEISFFRPSFDRVIRMPRSCFFTLASGTQRQHLGLPTIPFLSVSQRTNVCTLRDICW